jgi:hypothetical protein
LATSAQILSKQLIIKTSPSHLNRDNPSLVNP